MKFLCKVLERSSSFCGASLTIKKTISSSLDLRKKQHASDSPLKDLSVKDIEKKKNQLLKDMKTAAGNLEFEKAATLRDELRAIEALEIKFL